MDNQTNKDSNQEKNKPKIKIPETIFGVRVKGALERALAQEKTDKDPTDQSSQNINAPDKKGFIYVPSINLYLAKEKTLFNKDWDQTHIELSKQGLFMPTIYQFKEFIKYLKDPNGYQNRSEADKILDEILTVRNPWRMEHLDACFENKNNVMYINYNHRIVNGKLEAKNREKLEDCLMKDKTPGIDLEDWLSNANKQGLPKPDVKEGKLYYWYPQVDYVARFVANSVRAYLYGWNPSDTYSSLGVRAAREKT